MLKVFPDSLPFPLLASTTFKQASNILRSELDTGTANQLRRGFILPTKMAASWQLNLVQAAIFERFYEYDLKENEWFSIKIPTPLGLILHDVRFVGSPMDNYKLINSFTLLYECTIEIKERILPTEIQMAEASIMPSTLEDFVNGIACAINSYWNL